MRDSPSHCKQSSAQEAVLQEAPQGVSDPGVHQTQGGDGQGAQGGVQSLRCQASQGSSRCLLQPAQGVPGHHEALSQGSNPGHLRVSQHAPQSSQPKSKLESQQQAAGGPLHRGISN